MRQTKYLKTEHYFPVTLNRNQNTFPVLSNFIKIEYFV